ncbi:chorismate mutase [Streptomyces sp. CA-132043]|uniref:chorismate mutase n=1 Tax=Streptomyces sp. CA-132043 TaxID=3240048 RepID=UPI003D94608D
MAEPERGIRAIRGAVQVAADTREAVGEATRELIGRLLPANGLGTADVVSAFFTATPDLTSELPVLAASEAGWSAVPMLCAAEMAVPGALPRVVRVMVHAEMERARPVRHVYLPGTTPDRPAPAAPGGNRPG